MVQTAGSAGNYQVGSGIAAIFSSISTLAAARADAKQFKMQRVFDDLAIKQEKLKARENAIFLRKKFMQNIASANASFAARGVESGSGITRQFQVESLRTLGEDLQANDLNMSATQNSLRVGMSQSQLSGDTARNTGMLRASQGFGQGATSLLTGFNTIATSNSKKENG